MRIKDIHEKFTRDFDALWARFKADELAHSEYRSRVELLERCYRASLAAAREQGVK